MTIPTILRLVEEGLPKNRTGVCLATRRDGGWIETSPERFAEQVEQLALGLHELGVRRGDRVAIHAENCAEWVIADQAVLSLGGVTVPIYTTQPGDQVEFILRDSGAVGYVVSTAALHGAVAERPGAVETLRFTLGIRGVFAEGMRAWGETLARGRAAAAARPGLFAEERAAVRPDDLATLIYTSGTTGTPKGVMLTHANLASNVLASLERMPWDIEGGRGKNILSYLPLSHVFERMLSYLYLHIGYPVWFVERHEEILQDLQTVRPIHFSSVPRLLEKVHAGILAKPAQLHGAQRRVLEWGLGLAARYDVERPLGPAERVQYALADALVFRKLRTLFGGNLEAITSGGAALSAPVMNFINAVGIFCGQGYGLTETSPVIAVYTRGGLRAGSVGTPLRGVELRLADDGEILVRGPGVMQGYFNNPAATAEAVDADGWFRTGDIGRVDEQGHLFITDRKKELLKLSTGKYVAPQPIEGRLAASALVEQAVVVGNGRPFCSALLVVEMAAVRRRLEERGTPLPAEADHGHPAVRGLVAEEVEAANRGLAPWEQVKRFSLVLRPWSVETGELTPTLKVKRRVVHERHEREIQEMYA